MTMAEITLGLVVAAFLILLLIASISDIMYRRIPNWTVLAIGALSIPWILLAPNATVVSSGEAILAVFAISFPLYLARVFGAGDSKLLMSVALLVGASNLL